MLQQHNHKISNHLRATTAITSALALIITSSISYAAPQGGQINAGGGSISTSGKTTTVNQTSGNVVIDWNSYNVNSDETVNYVQPSSSAIALNRIHDQNPSSINGTINANGNVWFINPHGMIFGPNAVVSVGGMLATSSDISNDDFMNGNYIFSTPGDANATISNQGMITIADGGFGGFVGPNVINSGYIQANLGKVQLASGDTFILDLYGDGLINIVASDAITQQIVSNSGSIVADGGQIMMTAAAANNAISSVINTGGLLQANSVTEHNGVITLAAVNGSVENSGTIVADGGQINVIANNNFENSGLIQSDLGTIGISTGVGNLENDGIIKGDSSLITLYSGLADIINTGTISANVVGVVQIAAGGNVENDGTIEASGGRVNINATNDISQFGSILADNGTITETYANNYNENINTLTRAPNITISALSPQSDGYGAQVVVGAPGGGGSGGGDNNDNNFIPNPVIPVLGLGPSTTLNNTMSSPVLPQNLPSNYGVPSIDIVALTNQNDSPMLDTSNLKDIGTIWHANTMVINPDMSSVNKAMQDNKTNKIVADERMTGVITSNRKLLKALSMDGVGDTKVRTRALQEISSEGGIDSYNIHNNTGVENNQDAAAHPKNDKIHSEQGYLFNPEKDVDVNLSTNKMEYRTLVDNSTSDITTFSRSVRPVAENKANNSFVTASSIKISASNPFEDSLAQ